MNNHLPNPHLAAVPATSPLGPPDRHCRNTLEADTSTTLHLAEKLSSAKINASALATVTM